MMTKFADDPSTEHAKKQLAENKKVVERSHAEYAARAKGKPTPTQEENDLAALGAHIIEHEHDGGEPDPFVTRQLEADKQPAPKPYQTRAAAPKEG
jgi:sRNA-binding protein